MAAVRTALRRKQVVYLAPLKALAEEKYRDFKDKYASYGIKVILSTRDHRNYDADLQNGNFSIAVVVYEKLAQVLVRRPERLEEIELVIADELELLSDPDRGSTIEVLLTRIVQSNSRLIGLSAVLGDAERLAAWMGAGLLRYDRRPVELRYGVLHDGVFRYRRYNEYAEDTETLVAAASESPWETLTQNVCAFVESGETCLVFVKAKHEARRGAEMLAQRLNAGAAADALSALRELEPTLARNPLLATLENGVAFHSTDLTPEERRVVERAFRSGEASVLVSTSTLAVGMNLPARNVFITTEKWCYDQRFGMPWKAPITRSEYESMGGRAGRYGEGHAFGRSILVAATPFDQETLWRRYVEGERDPIAPRLAKEPLENPVLRLVASQFCRHERELALFLDATPSGQWVWREYKTPDEIELGICAAVNRCVDMGALQRTEDGRLEATPLGMAVARKGLSLGAARELEQWIAESETRTWNELDLLLAAALTPDAALFNVQLTTQEYDNGDYVRALRSHASADDAPADVPLGRMAGSSVTPFFEEVRAIKVALFLNEWMNFVPVRELEDRYRTLTGQILTAAAQLSWIIDAAAEIARAQGCGAVFVGRIRTIAERVQRGLRDEALPLARLGDPGISRSALAALVAHHLHTAQAIAETPAKQLARFVTPAQAQSLKAWAHLHHDPQDRPGSAVPPLPEPGPLLVVDDRRPGTVLLDGHEVAMQDKQYQLIRLLAATPGECVSYDTIYEELWGTVVVETNQMHFQKRKLVARIKDVAPQYAEVVKTVPKRGFMLELRPEQVERHVAKKKPTRHGSEPEAERERPAEMAMLF